MNVLVAQIWGFQVSSKTKCLYDLDIFVSELGCFLCTMCVYLFLVSCTHSTSSAWFGNRWRCVSDIRNTKKSIRPWNCKRLLIYRNCKKINSVNDPNPQSVPPHHTFLPNFGEWVTQRTIIISQLLCWIWSLMMAVITKWSIWSLVHHFIILLCM